MAKKNLTLEEKLNEAIVKDGAYEVPGNWVWLNLGSIIKVSSGKGLTAKQMDNTADIPVYGGNGFVGYHNEFIFESPQVIIGRVGANCGNVHITDDKCWVTDNALVVSYNEELVNTKFLYYLLKINELGKYSNSSAQPVISGAKIYSIPIPFPPLKEQRRIVDRIESLFEKLDKGKELIEEAREGFEKRKSSILEKAFRGELTEKWREENSLVVNTYERVKDEINERKELYCKVKKKDMPNFMNYSSNDIIIDSLLPSNWIKCPIGLLCDCIVPGRDKPKSFTGQIPWITIPNLTSSSININSSELKLSDNEISEVNGKKIPIDSVVMSCVGRFGISAIVEDECVINQQLHAFLPSKLIDKKYLMYQIKILQSYLEHIATSTTIAYVNKTGCNSLPINLAPIEEQKEIVRILDKLFEEESKIEELTRLEEQIELIKKSILAKAFRGELGTNCEEDKSALELLKEILSKDI